MMLEATTISFPMVMALIGVIFLCGFGIGFIQGRGTRD